MANPGDVTELLQAWAGGDESARDAVVSLVYAELRRIAERRMGQEREPVTLQPTALVHEAYLRLVDAGNVRWQSRVHFFAIAARVMRRILVERYRARHAQKRFDPAARVELVDDLAAEAAPEIDLELLGHALDGLAEQDARQAQIVELRYFGGLTIEEVAEAVQLSPATVKREWAVARAWLKREMDHEP